MAIGARVLGLAKLEQKFKRLPKIARDMVRGAMEQGADDIVDMMKRLAPVDDGKLRDSIGWRWGKKAPRGSDAIATMETGLAADWTITIYAGNKEAFYARWVEFGTQASMSVAPRVDRRYKSGKVMTQGKAAHAATPAQPFFYVTWRAKDKETKRRIRRAITKAAKTVAAGG
ncbi:HK97-gp10 family putative phage morphogenesis protein [Ochrobactrum sp. Marseille-Q0166]|uniref:HK97-gp10 family putative phage morphogenesis protein n=1 Tax=Ochrobactrum sp. Marseille-Q0166 TaxID=2761105 RepID=UPI001656281D|nr:HK97-gp10 family putative phage morphogenesis protein [Ochrobactrum sp. Marseille-Q0166]MBC8719305.1 HK97 gp10 family phage protein [Ochrobactrum sp. Marseille-Q0166]